MHNEWISVEDRLPETNQLVLIHIIYQRHLGHHIETDEFITGGIEGDGEWWLGNRSLMWDYIFNLNLTEDDLVEWQPLPEPPTWNE